MALRFVWRPTDFWDGRRWEVQVDGILCGRVMQFQDGSIDAAVWAGQYTVVPGAYSSLRDAALGLIAWCNDNAAELARKRRGRR